MMSFNYTISKISLLTCVFLSLFSEAGIAVILEVENVHTSADNRLLSTQNLKIAQAETEATANLETEIVDQINRARENPGDYADWLEEQKQYYDGITLKLPGEKPVRTNKVLEALTEAIDFVRQQSPLAPLTYSEAMAIAAQAQLTPIADTSTQNISYGKVTAEGIVFQLVVDERFRDRRHRLAIFNSSNQEVGVSCREDTRYDQICAIAYAETPEEVLVPEALSTPEEVSVPEDLSTPEEVSVPEALSTPEEVSVPEDLSTPEDSASQTETESLSEITVEPETEIPPDIEVTTIPEPNQEAISVPESTSTAENVTKPEIEDENATRAALNVQPNNFPLIDKVERGFLEEGDKVIPNDGSFYDSYPLSGKAGESFVISLESADFDTFLAIMDEEGNVLEQNDDLGEDDRNSQLQVTFPRDGTYSLIINAYDQGGTGAYILTIRRNRPLSLENEERTPIE